CEFRPLCPAYRRLTTVADEELPNDIFGRITERHLLGNGRVLFELCDAQDARVLVRGIRNDAERHPALPLLVPRRDARFFNLAGSRAAHDSSETKATVAVVYAA